MELGQTGPGGLAIYGRVRRPFGGKHWVSADKLYMRDYLHTQEIEKRWRTSKPGGCPAFFLLNWS